MPTIPRNALTQFVMDIDPGANVSYSSENPLFGNDRYLQGQIESLTLPDFMYRQVDWPIFGDGKRWVDAGLDEMKLTFISVNFSPGFFGVLGKYVVLRINNGVFTGHGIREQSSGFDKQIIDSHGPIIQITPSEQKPGELAKLTIVQNVEIFRVTQGNYTPIAINALNGIRRIDGFDQLAAVRGAFFNG